MVRKRFVSVLFLALSSVATAGDLTPEQRALILGKPGSVTTKGHVARIPLEGTDYRGFYKCPYMRVYVNGRGPFTFLFDTGSSYTIFSSKVIKEANVPLEVERGGHHDLVRVKQIRVGGVEINDLVAVRDDNFGVDGVLGIRAFGDFNLVFELKRHRLIVSPEPVPLPRAFEVPYKLDHNLPTVPVMVGTAEVAMLLDTGDDAFALETRTQDLKGAALAHPPLPAETVLNGGAISSQTFVATLNSTLRLGPLTIENAVVGINDALPVPDFGVDFMQDFNIEFNPKRMVVIFQPLSASSGTKIRGSRNPGFTLRFDKKGTVAVVIPGSPADQSGMHSGDRILSINGRPIYNYAPRAWDKALSSGKPLAVRWLQGTTARTDLFAVTELH